VCRPSPKCDGVTKSVRTPRFRACCPTVTDAYPTLTLPYQGESRVRDLGPCIPARKGTEGARGVTFPASSSRPATRRRGRSAPGRPWSSLVSHRFTKDDHASRGGPQVSRKSDFRTNLWRMFHEPLTSWAWHCGHSPTGPPREAQDRSRTGAAAAHNGRTTAHNGRTTGTAGAVAQRREQHPAESTPSGKQKRPPGWSRGPSRGAVLVWAGAPGGAPRLLASAICRRRCLRPRRPPRS
jgi:hypothetical protein